jgi:hypothetical protein
MTTDPRRGLPSEAERRRTNFPLHKDGILKPRDTDMPAEPVNDTGQPSNA